MARNRHDIEYVQRVLKIWSIDLAKNSGTVMRRRRQMTRKLLNWRTVDDAARDGLMAEAHRYVANQEHSLNVGYVIFIQAASLVLLYKCIYQAVPSSNCLSSQISTGSVTPSEYDETKQYDVRYDTIAQPE